MVLTASGIVSLHTHIHTDKEILEIQTDAGSIGCRYLLIELVELEDTAWLILVVLDSPDITRIEEQAKFDHPEQLGTILQVNVKADVTTLVDEVGQGVVAVVTAWAQGAHAPAANTVGTATVETLLKGEHVAVTIRDGYAGAHVKGDRLATVDVVGESIVSIGLDILGVTDAK